MISMISRLNNAMISGIFAGNTSIPSMKERTPELLMGPHEWIAYRAGSKESD